MAVLSSAWNRVGIGHFRLQSQPRGDSGGADRHDVAHWTATRRGLANGVGDSDRTGSAPCWRPAQPHLQRFASDRRQRLAQTPSTSTSTSAVTPHRRCAWPGSRHTECPSVRAVHQFGRNHGKTEQVRR